MRLFDTTGLVDKFHFFYYHHLSVNSYNFCGYPVWQMPMDLMSYHEIINEKKPQAIVLSGLGPGGQLLFLYANTLFVPGMGKAVIIGIDNDLSEEVKSLAGTARMNIINGDSVDLGTIAKVKELIGDRTTMVILDSDHKRSHVIAEMEAYGPLVSPGQFMVVEDTNINGHPVSPAYGPGPYEAVVDYFAKGSRDFVIDTSVWEKSLFTFHTWLRKNDLPVPQVP